MGFNIERTNKPFVVKSPYQPSGDQPKAIEELATRIENGENDVVLMGATGTGKTATAEQAAEVCTFIRTTVRHLYGARIARSITIQYGGSMKPGNAAELLGQPDIDGGLIGGASLNAADFIAIINAANQG